MLQELRSKELRRLELKEKISQLEAKLPVMEKELFALFIEKHNEEADYENLQSFSVKNWLLDLTGKKEVLLDKERREAQAAKLKHDTAQRQLEWVKQQLAESREELKALLGNSAAYWTALEEAGEEALLQEQRERAAEELEKTARQCLDVLELTRNVMTNVSNLCDRNKFGSQGVNVMMPSLMAKAQKQLQLLEREQSLFMEQASNLGLKEQLLSGQEKLFVADEQNWSEALSALTRDSLLQVAYISLEASENSLCNIHTELCRQIEELK